MISALIRELFIPLLVFLLLRTLLRGVFTGLGRSRPRVATGSPPKPARTGGTLHKDPVCGTYVSADSAVAQNIGGQTVYFCSAACSDRYRASR